MANRKTRKQRYQENVYGKIGNIDMVKVDPNAEYFINKRGGKVYNDITKHQYLNIPESIDGIVYEVLSVGNHALASESIITIKSGDLVQVYRLPNDYSDWVQQLRMDSAVGRNPFPCKVEFGKNLTRFYAEFVL